MKKLSFSAWLLIVFLGMFFLLFLLLPSKEYSSVEKRVLAEAPTITWDSLYNGSFSEELEDYLADHFPMREFFVGVSAYWDLAAGRNGSNGVYHCRDGYLIQAPAEGSLEQFTDNVTRFANFAEDMGLPATLLMVPETGYILSDLLPASSLPYRDDEAFEIAGRVCGDLTVLDPRPLFSQLAKSQQLYYRTDHHLTSRGCYTLYSLLCLSCGRSLPEGSDYTITTCEGFRGTTCSTSGWFLTAGDSVEIWDDGTPLTVTITEAGEEEIVTDSPFFLENLESEDMYTVFLDGNHTLVKITNPEAAGGRLLIIRDSFAHCLAPFLASDYSEILLVDLRYYRGCLSELAAEEGITEILFVYGLGNLLSDTNSAWLF